MYATHCHSLTRLRRILTDKLPDTDGVLPASASLVPHNCQGDFAEALTAAAFA